MRGLVQKVIMTLFLSLLLVFPSFFNIVLISPSSIAYDGAQIVQQVESISSYSVCNAATDNKSWNKNKVKKPIKEASFLSKAAGFGIGVVVCSFMMGLAAVISMSIFHNDILYIFDFYNGELIKEIYINVDNTIPQEYFFWNSEALIIPDSGDGI